MRRLTSTLIQSSTLFLACYLPLAYAQSSNPNLNRWARTADLTVARDQACAAVLNDGRLLVAGGMGASGPLATVDIYSTDGTFAAGPAMSQARAQAACVTLRDGSVLVTGGDGGSGALNTAEIFDPAANAWKPTGNLAVAREGHQAAVTIGGNVWIAGGSNQSGIVGAIEMYGAGKFRAVGSLNTPRVDFAMAPAGERNLLVAGGSDGTNTLSSVELYDGLTQKLTVAGNMLQARRDFAAAPLLDDTVLLTGGMDGDGNLLATTEIFDTVAGLSTAGPSLLAARANHVAYTLPNNASVLIFGGAGFSTVLNSTEIFTPWTGKIGAASPLSVPRRNEAKAALRPGSFLIAGGRDDNGSLSSSELYQFATVGTDKPDYSPGTPVKISGGGWAAGEQVLVEISALPLSLHHVEFTGTATADGAGNITLGGFAVDQSHLGMKFLMTATGSQSEAQATFTDKVNPIVTLAFNPPSGTAGSPATVTITVSKDQASDPVIPLGDVQLCDGSTAGGNGTCPSSFLTATPCPNPDISVPGYCILSQNGATATTTMNITTPSGNTNFGVIYVPDTTTNQGGTTAAATYNVVEANQDFQSYSSSSNTTISMTSGPAPGATAYGSTTPYVATVTVTGGGTATGPVTFCDTTSGSCTGSTDPNAIGTVTLTNASNNMASFVPSPPLAVGSHTIIAHYGGNTSDNPSTTTNSIITTIAATNTTTSYTLTPSGGPASAPPATIVFSQPISGTATVTAQSGGGTPTGTVQFAVDATNVGAAASLTSGSTAPVALGSSLGVGTHTVSATYTPAGNTGWNSSSGNNGGATAITVTAASSTVGTPQLSSGGGTGTPTFTIDVTGTAPATANPTTGTVTLYDGTVGNTTNPVGSASLAGSGGNPNRATITTSALSAGPHTIWAQYAGSTGLQAGEFALANSVGTSYTNTTPTATTVQTPTGPASFAYGGTVTYNGTVTASSGANSPAGPSSNNSMTFCFALASSPGTSVLCSSPMQVTVSAPTVGQAFYTVPAGTTQLTPGSYVLTTTYHNNDGLFSNSGPSSPLSVTITQAPAPFTVSATVNAAPVTAGQNILVTSSVTYKAQYTGTLTPNPTGTVSFVNGAVSNALICSATLVNGLATCTATAGPGGAAGLAAGSVNATLSYAGDTNYSLGTVTTLSNTVVKDSVNVTVVATSADSPNPTQIGRSVTLTATVTAATINVSPAGTTPTQANISITPPATNVSNSTCGTPTAGATTTNSATVSCTFTLAGNLPSPPTLSFSANYATDVYTLPGSANGSMTLAKASTTTTITSVTNTGGDANTAVEIGRLVTITARTVTGANVATQPNGSFTFNFSPGSVTPNNTGSGGSCGTLTAGATTATVTTTSASITANQGVATATCTFILTQPAGTNSYAATYNGDVNTLTSSTASATTITSVLAPTVTTLAVPTNNGSDPNTGVQYGRVVTLTATAVTAANDFAPLNGSFTFSLPANSALTSSCGTLVSNGTTATVTTTMQAYANSNTQNSATASCMFILVGPNPIAPGIYNVTYNGDSVNTSASNSQGSSTTRTITPALDATTLLATCTFGTGTPAACPNNAGSALVYGQPFTLASTLDSTTPLPADGAAYQASKNVTITGQNGIDYVIPIVPTNGVGGANVAGNTTITSPTGVPFIPPAGAYTLTFNYPTPTADPDYGPSSTQVSFVINKAPVTVLVTPLTVGLAGTPNLQVTVSFAAPSVAGIPTGTVTVLNGNTPVGSATLGVGTTNCPSGRASCASALFSLPTGSYNATYSGDSNFLAGASGTSSSTTGVQATSSLTLSANPNPAQPGQSITITATVSGTNGNGTPTGSVSFTDNGTLIGVAPVVGGIATLTVTLAPGQHVVSASYSGDTTFPAASNNLNISVTKPNANTSFSSNVTVSVFGQGVTLTVRFTSPTTGGAVPTGTVQFLDNGQPIGSPVTIVNGVATLTLASLPPGTNNIGVQYSGDGSFANLTKNVGTVTVSQAQVTTALTSTTNGNQMTLTATVTVVAPGAGTPTGTVQFIDTLTGAVLGTATLKNGVATITITATGDPIKAVYSGDTNFGTSQSPASATIAVSDAASYAQTYAPGEIVTVFGTNLAASTVSASLPLPTTLGGVTVTVTDSAGVPRQAVLFYVSASQLSFLIPAGTATGTATVVVNTSAGSLTTTITITASSAALFTANANGSGPLAAQVVSVTPGGQQTYTNTATLSGTTFVNAPISLSPASNQYVLLLYGTGFDNAKTVTVTINGQTFTPAYAGPQGTFAGLDQINVLLPASLAGTGQVNVSITVDGQTSNVGTIAFAAAGTN